MTDCPSCGSRLSVDEDGYCNAGCGFAGQLYAVGDVLSLGGPARYLVTAIKAGKVSLTKIDPMGPEVIG